MENLTPMDSVAEVGPDGADVEQPASMSYYADAEFDTSTRTHLITVSANRGEGLFLQDIAAEECEDAAVCVCRATLTKDANQAKARKFGQAGGSLVETKVKQTQPFKFVVVTDGTRILTVCDVRHV